MCKVDDAYKNTECSSYINEEYFDQFFKENCKRQESCTFSFADEDLFIGDIEAGKLNEDDDTCLSLPTTQMFVQYTCEETNI